MTRAAWCFVALAFPLVVAAWFLLTTPITGAVG